MAEDGDIKYITITTNAAEGSPGNANRVAAFEVSFPADQMYDLYVRFRIGAGNITSTRDLIRLDNSLPPGMYILQLYDERFAYSKKYL